MCSTSGAHDLGPVPSRITVDSELVQRLIGTQFPQWSALEVTPVALGGWDNWTFHHGPEMFDYHDRYGRLAG
jgi:aminoglycoside phosphotransferase (APT) family kinase protein